MKNPFKIEIPENRNFGLDLLRFIAIFTVLVSHSITVLPERFYFVHKFIFDGVLVFFVLSGFLIGRIIIKSFSEGITFKKVRYFWQRRWWRTLPAFYFAFFLLIILSLIFNKIIHWPTAFKTLFFSQNLVYHSGEFFPEAWSLSIEEWFYLILPITLFSMFYISKKFIKTTVLFSFVIIFLISFCFRFYFHLNSNVSTVVEWDQTFRSPVITRLDSLLFGVLGAWFYIFKKDLFKNYQNLFFIIGASIFIINKIYGDYFLSFNFYTNVLLLSIMPFSILLMLPKLYYLNETKLPILNKIITEGSLISYSMYLINLSIVSHIFLVPLSISIWLKFVLFWILTILISKLIYNYVEIPFIKMRK